MIYILGGTIRQSEDYAKSKRLKQVNVRIISQPYHLHGIRDITLVLVGTYYDHRDFEEMTYIAQHNGILMLKDESW